MKERSKTSGIDLARLYFHQQSLLGIRCLYLPSAPHKPDPVNPVLALVDLQKKHSNCRNCDLCKYRTKLVFGEGSPNARLMFIEEAPGYDEDMSGRPFVGKAGKLLDKIINAMGVKRNEVYIGNIIKCRPPENRDPSPVETQTCMPILIKQIEIIKPQFICVLGRIAAHRLLNIDSSLSHMRGKFYNYMGARLMVTYHPAALLRHEEWKRPTWEDIQMLMREMEQTANPA
ncbi:MAG: uracil-DNA glycosylase [bacterium]